MDGLLLDTEPFYTKAAQEVLKEFGKNFDWDLKSRMMGRPAIVSARILVKELDLPITPEEYLRRREKKLTDIFPTALPKRGSMKLTGIVKAMKIPQAVATSSSRHIYELKTQRHRKWFAIFDVIITGDDPEIKKGKPAPDIFLLAAKRINAEPERCLVFEDSLSGVKAGLAAGMNVVAVPDPNINKERFKDAHQILGSIEEFNIDDWIFLNGS